MHVNAGDLWDPIIDQQKTHYGNEFEGEEENTDILGNPPDHLEIERDPLEKQIELFNLKQQGQQVAFQITLNTQSAVVGDVNPGIGYSLFWLLVISRSSLRIRIGSSCIISK